jgi:hypothetical protein
MSHSRRDLTRLIALGSAAGVIGVPVALIASTWQPLEPTPSNRQIDDGEEESRPGNDRKRPRRGTESSSQLRDASDHSGEGAPAPGTSSPRRATPGP